MDTDQPEIRNIAIIAHVDHGKTTLVDQLLKQSGAFRSNQAVPERVMDTDDLERERGITIFSKNASIDYQGIRINVVDTPGHSDFGGDVERVLKMADGVLLLVDAVEGPMPQTTFVLRKALDHGLPAIVVVNKIDRPLARPHEAVDKVFDLFVDLEADESLLDFPVIYCDALKGIARRKLEDQSDDLRPLLQEIVRSVPPPGNDVRGPFQMLVSALDYNDYVGRFGIGRIFRGQLRPGDTVAVVTQQGEACEVEVNALHGFRGMERKPIEHAVAGDIVAITGIEDLNITDTLTHPDHPESVPTLPIDEPTVQMMFTVSDSPFVGQDGTYVTSRQLRRRLYRELHTNVSLKVQDGETKDRFLVSGRGLLHLGILVENLRREGYELMVGKPKVIHREIDGRTCEPFETAVIDVPTEALGTVMQLMGSRGGEPQKVENLASRVQMVFEAPSRSLMGVRSRLLSCTRGEAIFYHVFLKYAPVKTAQTSRQQGVLVSSDAGEATFYALDQLRMRGQFFVRPGTRTYPGMIVGEHCEENDLAVRVSRTRKLTNVRAASADRLVVLREPREITLEYALEYVEDDEWVEVTPKAIRLRKKVLDEKLRKRQDLGTRNGGSSSA